jgi:hypothetical protein
MQWRTRAIVGVAACLFLVACASIAGLEEPLPAPDDEEDARAPSSDAGREDVADATAVDVCTRAQLEAPCESGVDCCSGSCNEKRTCVNDCRPAGQECNVFSDEGCCANLWCAGSGGCAPCIPAGSQAATDPSNTVVLEHSCCSRNARQGVCAP